MIFKGTVYKRSSADHPSQPEVAGEREVFKCNLQRVRRIMKETGCGLPPISGPALKLEFGAG